MARRTWIATALMMSLAGCAAPPTRQVPADPKSIQPAAPPAAPADDPDAALIAEVVAAHNAARADAKLPSLQVNPKLTAAARREALDMAKRGKMDHTGSDGSTPFERITEAGYNWQRAGENIAYGRYTAETVMDGWLKSPLHKKNILGGYSQLGVAVARSENGTQYWCVDFGLPKR